MTDQPTAIDDATIAAIRGASRVCFFAHYHPQGITADHVLFYLAALKQAGFSVVVLSTATMDAGEQAKLRGACAALVMRENRGLDFGGWMEAVKLFFPLTAEFLLLANDSVYGPLADLGAFIARLTAVPADFYGIIESYEAGRAHFQSWFLLLRPSAYRSPAFATLMSTPISDTMSKLDIIVTYEQGLTGRLRQAGLIGHPWFSVEDGGRVARQFHYNPMQLTWCQLVARKAVPFVKIELLRDNPMRVPDAGGWRRVVGARAAKLVPMIADDLARRQRLPGMTLLQRLEWSVDEGNPAVWPELRRFVVLNTASSRLTARLGWIAFRLTEPLGRRARAWVRERASAAPARDNVADPGA